MWFACPPAEGNRLYKVLLSLATVAAAVTLAAVAAAEHASSPFVSQTPESLAWLYRFDLWAPRWAWFLLALGVASIVGLWRAREAAWAWRSYLGTAGCVLLLAGAVGATHVRRLEVIMFKPLPGVEHVAITEADHVEGDMPVMGVVIGGEARAYPLSLMAYHHIANDVVANQPIVATY